MSHFDTQKMENRFLQNTGYATLGHLVSVLLDSDRLDGYEDVRIIEAVEMTPEHFWDRHVGPMLDRMANDLRAGFEEAAQHARLEVEAAVRKIAPIQP